MVAREEGSEDLLWTGLYSRGPLAGRLAGQGATRIWLFAFSRSLARSLAATREMQGRATGQVAGTGEPEGNGKGMEREWSGRARGEWEAGEYDESTSCKLYELCEQNEQNETWDTTESASVQV